ncbi:Short chain dehydrogenase reductase family [Colletotrichum higginsianum IMI 349063]|uniref:Short chain dehydrogenase reductase family n=2 Tax=Colletotrichum higginsianum TaxID=80884 RepID=A0A1B7Y0P5_COLHI|nr:Short chain dehydrogenase reductase family [Colletotrichum higginsianum IMI 349063]OBR05590.1 Short chain dehydrogenase reductase family [Colletotrichum higginsianum IMI 349063]
MHPNLLRSSKPREGGSEKGHGDQPSSGAYRGGPSHGSRRKLILCFDGTGNKFRGDDSDSNILKIFRMLDSSSDDQCGLHNVLSKLSMIQGADLRKYLAGIGTYVVSENLTHNGVRAKCKSWYQMAKDSAVGSSFDQHVVGGYRFLMRYYSPGDDIYMFGFSRGAYVARFLAEMLDFVGLLLHGNEEMVSFAWSSFSQWQCRRTNSTAEGKEEREKMYRFLKGFRETFSRPIRRIRFLGLFDTVNSVPRFETAWMQRSKFPYTARSSAKVVRHAVSIDERRAKFRQDLIYQEPKCRSKSKKKEAVERAMARQPFNEKVQEFQEKYRPGRRSTLAPDDAVAAEDRGRRKSRNRSAEEDADHPIPFRSRSRSRSRATDDGSHHSHAEHDASSTHSKPPMEDLTYESDDDEADQDVDEVWFAGGHGDIGGGWDAVAGRKNASHIPLVWMVREAMRAGLSFDVEQLEYLGCVESVAGPSRHSRSTSPMPQEGFGLPEIHVDAPSPPAEAQPESPSGTATEPTDENSEGLTHACTTTAFSEMIRTAQEAEIHDSLDFACGMHPVSVFMWRVMEYLPFRRLDLRPDGSWKPIRWPLPRGEVRDIPDKVRVHGSVIRRMERDEMYRPGNLIVGGGGRGCRFAPKEYGMGEWVCVKGEGDSIDEVWVRKPQDN